MPYIDRDIVLKLLERNSITKHITFSDGVSIYDTIANIPTADVVPKSEVERLRSENADLQDALKCQVETNAHLNGEYISLMKECESQKAEIERLIAELSKMDADLQEQCAEFAKRQLPSYCQVCSEEEAINIGREYGKTEAARKIFAEIENLFAVENFRLICNRQAFAELKKKYTEDQT